MPEDATTLQALQALAPTAKPGDRLITPACDEARDEEALNWARRFLFKPQ